LRVRPPPAPDALAWLRAQDAGRPWTRLLELAGGAPLLAVRFADAGLDALDASFTTDLLGILRRRREPLEVAANWQRSELAAVLRWLYAWTAGLIRLRSAGAAPALAPGELETLQTAAEGIPLQRLYRYLDEVGAAATRLDGALNAQLVIESLLAPWADGLEPVVANATQGYLADR
jgi:DNA polymerase-3 subunit delta'